jgi:hypothetical protein
MGVAPADWSHAILLTPACGWAKLEVVTPRPLQAMSEQQLKAFLEAVKADAGLQEKLKAAADADTFVAIAKAAGFVPGVNYVGGSRQLRRRVPAPHPLPWQGVGRAVVGGGWRVIDAWSGRQISPWPGFPHVVPVCGGSSRH